MTTATISTWIPKICKVDAIEPAGCLFHVASGTENFRVNAHGGELDFTRRMVDAIRPDDVFFDAGACIGYVSIHARKRGAKVVAFEPEPTFRARLLDNLTLNQMDDVQVIGWAVSDCALETQLYTDGAHGTSPSLTGGAGRGIITIKTQSLDTAVAIGEIPSPHLIKLDIEGYELRALRGMTNILSSNNRPRMIFIEVHPTFMQAIGDDHLEMKTLLNNAGYTLIHETGRWDQLHQIWRAPAGDKL